ncbi:hypothetical protein K439DRAFT_1252780, partial [Ramaria rubella]
PPLLRYKWENMYLAGIIPGPNEPSLEEVNHFIMPLVQSFKSLWSPGVYFNRTAKFPEGRLIRCAILSFVADMKGSRKTAGSRRCALCRISHAEVVGGCCLDPSKWPRLSVAEYRRIAEQWLNAPSLAARQEIYEREGIRWTPLLLLEYWDPTKLIIVDAMHAIFAGLIPTHFRKIYGVDGDGAD